MPSLHQCVGLRELHLYHNCLNSTPSCVGDLTNLERLDVSKQHNFIYIIAFVQQFVRQLSKNELVEAPDLSSLTKLRDLRVSLSETDDDVINNDQCADC